MTVQEMLETGKYDTLDIGCSSGGSLNYSKKKLRAQPLGIDIDAKKVEAAIAAGHDAIVHNLLEQQLPRSSVKYCTLFHVLEHIDTFADIFQLVHEAINVATEAVLIRTPNFDLDGILARRGYKFYHSDWSGHKYPVTSLDYAKLLYRSKSKKIKAARIYGKQELKGTTTDIIPISAPINTSKIASQQYPDFDVNSLPERVFKETAVIILLKNRESGFSRFETRLHVNEDDVIHEYAPQGKDDENDS